MTIEEKKKEIERLLMLLTPDQLDLVDRILENRRDRRHGVKF